MEMGQEQPRPRIQGVFPASIFRIRLGKRENFALEEYMRTLRIFTDLVVHGKLPDEPNRKGGGWTTRSLMSSAPQVGNVWRRRNPNGTNENRL